MSNPFFVLAPMDDVTDVVFRHIIHDCAPADVYMTEFVNVDGLQSPGREKLLPRLRKGKNEQKLIAQLWGKNPDNYYKTVTELKSQGYAGIDINMGCPDKTIVKNGCCSAFILPENRERAVEIIKAVQSAAGGELPVSVKTRLGFNSVDLSWHELLLKQNLDMLIVHGRTKSQMSKVPADWQKIAEVRELRDKLSPDTKIVGNGDVVNRTHGLELASTYRLDGIMIGRGVFHDPFCFAEKSPWPDMPKQAKIELFKKHITLFKEAWPDGERRFDTLKKFAKIYINDFDGAKDLREQIMRCTSADEVLQLLEYPLPHS